MNHTIRTPQGMQTLSDAEIAARAKELVLACPSQITCAFRVWYEGFEGYGMPTKGVVAAIETTAAAGGAWACAGLRSTAWSIPTKTRITRAPSRTKTATP